MPRLLQVSSTERQTGASITEEISLSDPAVKPGAPKPAFLSSRLPAIVLAIWLTGVFVALVRLLSGMVGVWQMKRRTRPIAEGLLTILARQIASQLRLRGPIALLTSDRISTPMTCGLWRSVVVLPSDADQWSDESRHIVLSHELAHVKRRDCLTQMLAQVACVLYWFNPLVWWVARRLRIERELACDDQVLVAGARATDYAGCLVELAGVLNLDRGTAPIAVGMACSHLEARVRAILDPNIRRGGLNRTAVMLVGVGIAGFVLPLATMHPSTPATPSLRATSIAVVTREAFSDSAQSPNARVPVAPEKTAQSSRQQKAPGISSPDNLPERKQDLLAGSTGLETREASIGQSVETRSESTRSESTRSRSAQSESTRSESANEQSGSMTHVVIRQTERTTRSGTVLGFGQGFGLGSGKGQSSGVKLN